MFFVKFLRRYRVLGLSFLSGMLIVLLCGISAIATPFSSAAALTPASRQPIPTASLTRDVRKTVLSNGLTVLTKEVNTAPVVTVQVWYRVGSRNETPGINGIAHQLEHLMFKGTQTRPIQFGRFFSALGSQSNAFTSYDQTAYFGTVEQDKLKALLVLEADRMTNSVIGEKELASEKRVVISELQGYENNPDYRLGRQVMGIAFPKNPYGLPVGGTKADVERFTVQQVRDYYKTYYRPDNATLVIVGNFKTEPTLALVQETFGSIPKPATPLPAEPPTSNALPRPASTQPIVLKEPGSAPLLNLIYPLPNLKHPDVPALQLLDHILISGRSSRLYQALVETGLASDVSGYAAHLIGSGWFELSVTAAPGKELAPIDQVVQQTIADLRTQGVSAEELERAKTQFRAETILRNRDITNQAFQLADDQVSNGDYQYTDRLLAAVAKVTPAEIQRAARTYLAPDRRTAGFFEPTQASGKPGAAAPNATQTSENFGAGAPVDPAEVAKYLPPITESENLAATQPLPGKITLKNGLRLLLLPNRSTPTVTLRGFINAGSVFDKPTNAGLASLTAENVMNGTKTRDALAIATALEDRGASLEFSANREGVTIVGTALSSELPTMVQVLGDVLQNASFPDDELERSRQQALSSLKQELDNPGRLARRTFQQTVYPANHPYHTFPTEASLQQIRRDDLVRFYQQHYRPDATVLALVGDFEPGQVTNLLNAQLGTWEGSTEEPSIVLPPVPLPDRSVRLTPTLPNKAQSITFIGYSGINRRDPRYYSALVLNQILGGDTLSSRLGTEIRDRLGLTYGIYSVFQAGIYPGPFVITMQTAPEDADKAIASTLGLLKQIREKGVTTTEVAAAARSLSSSYSVDLADPDSLASAIVMNAVYGLGINEIRQFPTKVEAVTPAQVSQAIQEFLHPDRVVVVTAGPPVK